MSRMSQPIGVIADDLTGACDTAGAFATSGWLTSVYLRGEISRDDADVIGLSTDSRHANPAIAQAAVAHASGILNRLGIHAIYKKIDSCLRGNIGQEVSALYVIGKYRRAIICPAFPAQRRFVMGGKLISPSDSPKQIERLFREQGMAVDCCSRSLNEFLDSPHDHNITIVDAGSDSDLCAIARATWRYAHETLFVGSAGLARAIGMVLNGMTSSREVATCHTTSGPVVMVLGTTHDVTQRQVVELVATGKASELDVDASAINDVPELIRRGQDVVLRLRWAGVQEDRCLRKIFDVIPFDQIGGLLLSGGDSASHVCQLLDIRHIQIAGEIEDGCPWGRIGLHDRALVRVVTKSGGFGTPRTFCRISESLRGASPT